jgi:hypothetical protein
MMARKVLMSALAALAVSSSLAAVPTRAEAGEVRDRSTDVELAQDEFIRLGPYATVDRANQVAAYYRSLGFSVSAPYHYDGGYCVNVFLW